MNRIATSDEKGFHYDDPQRKTIYLKPGKPAKSSKEINIHHINVILCIWWDQKVVLCYELLKPGETNTRKNNNSSANIEENDWQKFLEFDTRHEAIILHHDNGRSYVTSRCRCCAMESTNNNQKWEKFIAS